jgi:hypothetical protein
MFKIINAKWCYNGTPVQNSEPSVQAMYDKFLLTKKNENYAKLQKCL